MFQATGRLAAVTVPFVMPQYEPEDVHAKAAHVGMSGVELTLLPAAG